MKKITEKRIDCDFCNKTGVIIIIKRYEDNNVEIRAYCPICNGKRYLAIIKQEKWTES